MEKWVRLALGRLWVSEEGKEGGWMEMLEPASGRVRAQKQKDDSMCVLDCIWRVK